MTKTDLLPAGTCCKHCKKKLTPFEREYHRNGAECMTCWETHPEGGRARWELYKEPETPSYEPIL